MPPPNHGIRSQQHWGNETITEDFKIDPNADPKNSFINYLIWEFKIITPMLYGQGRYLSEVAGPLRGLIDNLDENDKKALAVEYEKLRKYEKNHGFLNRNDFEDIYRNILSYVHKKYLQEILAKPRNPNPATLGEQKIEF